MTNPRKRKPPRAARKPAPATYGDWLSEVAGIHKFLGKRPEQLSPEAAEWLARTKTYYRERLSFLAANPPAELTASQAYVIAEVANMETVNG